MLTYAQAISCLEKIGKFKSRPGLARIKKLLYLLGNPQNDFKPIIVGGTNGKGSTVSMLSSILSHAGFATGAFHSPHVFDFRERIQINGRKIPKRKFANCACEVFKAIRKAGLKGKSHPTYFETLAAIAMLYFAKEKCDYAVLEVGMGGRLDATNICEPVLSCITSISLEHTNWLGHSIGEIAYEKAGIARKGKPLICSNSLGKKPLLKIKAVCRKKKAIFMQPKADDCKLASSAHLKLQGKFQKSNASIAVCAARNMGIPKKHILPGLENASMPARLQQISSFPKIIIDCAHNPEASKALSSELPKIMRGIKGRKILVFSAMGDKDYKSMLQHLSPYFDYAIIFRIQNKRGESASKLMQAAQKNKLNAIKSTPKKAIALARKLAGKGGAIVVCGSIYGISSLFSK